MQTQRILAPATQGSTKPLANLAAEAVKWLFAFCDLNVIPPTPDHDDYTDLTPGLKQGEKAPRCDHPTMAHIYATRFATHIRRVEHILRCWLFCLATRLLQDPESRAKLQIRKPVQRIPTPTRPYDPNILVQITKPDPKASFASLPYAAKPSRKRSARRYRNIPLDWVEVDVSRLIARMSQFSKVLTSAEKRAEALAARILAREFAVSQDELNAPQIRVMGGFCKPSGRKHCPVFLRHLAHWLPPPDLYAECHPPERDIYTELHRSAFEAALACPDF